MRPLSIETGATVIDMQTRPHPIGALRRWGNLNRRVDRDVTETLKRVANHVGLERELARIRDVGIDAAAAQWIGERLAPIERGLDDLGHGRKCQTTFHAFDTREDALAWDRAGDEDDLAVVPGDHATASRRLLHRQLDRLPDAQHGLFVPEKRKAEHVTHEAVVGRLHGASPHVRGHARSKRRQLGFCFAQGLRRRTGFELRRRNRHQLIIEDRQSLDDRRAGITTRMTRIGRQLIELGQEPLEISLEAGRASGSPRDETSDDAFEVRGEGRLPGLRCFGVSRRQHDANCASPLVVDLEDVMLAELDPNRPRARQALRLTPLDDPIDAALRDGQRNSLLRPATHLLEGRPDDPDQMTAILLTEVRFELTTVVTNIDQMRSVFPVLSVVHDVDDKRTIRVIRAVRGRLSGRA